MADGVVELGEALVDESILTGESHPVRRGPGHPSLAGSHNLSVRVQIRARAVGGDTRLPANRGLMDSAATSKPRSVLLADRLAKPFSWLFCSRPRWLVHGGGARPRACTDGVRCGIGL